MVRFEEIYVKQPEGYEIPGKEHCGYRLKIALYGLKQDPRAWYSELDKSLLGLGLNRSNHEPIVYYSLNNLSKLYVGVYVDDLLITNFKDKMKTLFDMTDLSLLKSYLGIQVKHIKGEITLSQSTFALKILFDFNLQDYNSTQTPLEVRYVYSSKDCNNQADSSTYRSLMGSQSYLTHTRPDVMFSTRNLNKYMEDPCMKHFASAKRLLRYIKGTMNFGSKYKRGRKLSLVCYCDSNYGGIRTTRKAHRVQFSFWEKTL